MKPIIHNTGSPFINASQKPVASPCTQIISGITLFKCEMYRRHFATVTVDQKWRIPFTSSFFVFGFTSLRRNSCMENATIFIVAHDPLKIGYCIHNYKTMCCTFNSCHRFSIGLASGLSGAPMERSMKNCCAC